MTSTKGADARPDSTSAPRSLVAGDLAVINLGLESFAQNLAHAGATVEHVDWRPAADGDVVALAALDRCDASRSRIDAANAEAVEKLLAAKPMLIGVGVAKDTIPGMHDKLFLHAGPPVTWDRMSGPTRGAVMGGLVYEGLAATPEEAQDLAASGEIEFAPCHHYASVGPMAGVVTPRMPVWIVENETFGNRAYCTLNEGLGKVLRYGAYGDEVFKRLRWMEKILAPAMSE
ncbi:MAG: DUF1116 domain-containing protein, partial [Deltaproteobacteria bacterium]|nr:DUF1116 domain-containing protein [Deltaproteobacteria bacterium]